MSELLLTIGTVALVVTLVVSVVVVWALLRTFRSVRRRATRSARRIQQHLPAQSFGSRLWWLAGRLDRVEDQAGYAQAASTRSFLAEDLQCLSAELLAAAAHVRTQVQAAGRLSGAAREREAARLEAAVAELEAGAAQLVETAAHLNVLHTSREGIGVGESVRRRAAALDAAVEELNELERMPLLPDALPAPSVTEDPILPSRRAVEITDRRA